MYAGGCPLNDIIQHPTREQKKNSSLMWFNDWISVEIVTTEAKAKIITKDLKKHTLDF